MEYLVNGHTETWAKDIVGVEREKEVLQPSEISPNDIDYDNLIELTLEGSIKWDYCFDTNVYNICTQQDLLGIFLAKYDKVRVTFFVQTPFKILLQTGSFFGYEDKAQQKLQQLLAAILEYTETEEIKYKAKTRKLFFKKGV